MKGNGYRKGTYGVGWLKFSKKVAHKKARKAARKAA